MKALFGDSYGGMIQLISKMQDNNNLLAKQNAREANEFSLGSQLQAQDYNAREAAKNRDFQMFLSDTAHQREVRDLKLAGLNPILSANNGAAVTSGASASSGSVQAQQAALDMQAAGLYSQLYMNKVNNANQLKMTNLNNKNARELAKISAAASMYGANASAAAQRFAAGQAAAASMYNAQLGFANAEAQRQWDELHPQNGWQAFFNVLAGAGLSEDFINWIGDVFRGKNTSKTPPAIKVKGDSAGNPTKGNSSAS